ETCCRRPVPPQSPQGTGAVPASAPLPRQVAQVTATRSGTFRVVPAATSASKEVVAEERREEVADAAEVEGRREAAAAKSFVAEAVVELATLGVRQHL